MVRRGPWAITDYTDYRLPHRPTVLQPLRGCIQTVELQVENDGEDDQPVAVNGDERLRAGRRTRPALDAAGP